MINSLVVSCLLFTFKQEFEYFSVLYMLTADVFVAVNSGELAFS